MRMVLHSLSSFLFYCLRPNIGEYIMQLRMLGMWIEKEVGDTSHHSSNTQKDFVDYVELHIPAAKH
jgi:hypothetical protein